MTGPADDAWAGERVARWVRQRDALEAQLAPVQDLLLSAAALQPGEAVLDVGCGTGPTSRAAALAVAPHGRVTGLDVSAEMLAAAALGSSADVPAGTSEAVTWVCGDATTWSSEDGYDVVLSRFGVMFFGDPAAAFANLARLSRSDGRLAVAVWGCRELSRLFEVPLRAAAGALPLPPVDEGPFSLSDVTSTERLLLAAVTAVRP